VERYRRISDLLEELSKEFWQEVDEYKGKGKPKPR
jgi:hypothetical protein